MNRTVIIFKAITPEARLPRERLSSSAVIELSTHGYEILRADEEFSVCRARQDGEQSTILVVTPVAEYPAVESLAHLENEYSLRDELDLDWAARPLALTRSEGRTILVLEDPGGEPLARSLGQPMELGRFLRLAINLAAGLGKLHHRGLIHKDIKPANILVESASNKVWFTGFGIASRLPRERQAAEPPEVIAGTLAYMAPEQTGRMNRSIDSRSDLYSLGVTFYEMLSGVLPFQASDPMEWVHCHIARQAALPGELTELIPIPVLAIVLKLLAKTAEDRYQTAGGLEADLRKCLMEWESVGHIKSFPVGRQDMPDRLLIPEKLYGRDSACQTLLTAFDRVVATHKSELLLLSGYAGVGKSSVVHELHKVIVLPRGIFISGKFDQHKRDIPYATLAQAFQELARQILSKSEEEIIHWRHTILEALGPNGQLMVNLIPELELVIGKQPPVLELAPQEAQNRFEAVLRGFLGAFARKEHPLVLFLDDLQWLDPAMLRLLEQLVTDPNGQHLLLIGAYRDNEVTSHHPLMLTLDAIRKTEAIVHEIELEPLSLADVNQLLSDALRCGPARAGPLAELVHEKTEGNPFFTIQFLTTLVEEHLLEFEAREAAWRWELDRIRAKGFTDNVVDLVAGKLNRLPANTQKALQQLACLGNTVEISTVSLVHGESAAAIHAALWDAVRAGLVFRLEDAYTFLHDRVQEAAYSLIPEELRGEAHLRIGRLLLSRTAPQETEEKIFEVVNQLNRGSELIDSLEERERVAELNVIAGKRAKTSAAYASALRYFVAGRALLPKDSWEQRYALTFALEFQRAECEFLTGDFAAAEERLSMLSERAENPVDRAAVTCLRAELYMTLDRSNRAVEVCLEYLRRIGVDWPPNPTKEEVEREYTKIWRQLDAQAIEQLVDLPLMTDPDCRATLDVLSVLATPAWYADENLHDLVGAHMVNLSLEHGNCDASCHAYALLGTILGSKLRQYRAGFRFGKLAVDLTEKRGLHRFKGRVYNAFGHHIAPWARHLRDGRIWNRRAFNAAKESGDLTYAAFSSSNMIANLLAGGDPLEEVQREAEDGLEFTQKMRFELASDYVTVALRLIRTLRGLTPKFGSFNDAEFDESRFEQHLGENPRLAPAACRYWIRKLQARFHAQDYASAIAAAAKAHSVQRRQSFFEVAEYPFYSALAHAALCNSAFADERARHLEAVATHHKQLALWTENCPENFENRAALVGAEIARIQRRELDAERLYEQAIRSAQANGFVHNEALANELAARFYRARGFEKIANAYLRDARYGYRRWGADGKVRQLDELYPHLREEERAPGPTSTIGASVEHLDLATVIKVSLAVSGEIVFENLIQTIMRAAIEHAGAERGLLILRRGEEDRIEAEARTERDGVEVQMRQAAATPAELPESLLCYVIRTQQTVILDDASSQSLYSDDPYVLQKRPRSVLCLPLVKQAKLIGALYLENNLAPRVFTPRRLAILELLASQAAISLDHARLYVELTQENTDRRKAEEALRASEERLQDIVDNTTAVIFVKDLELRYLLVNSEFERRHRIQRDHIRGKTDFDVHPPEIAEAVRANDRRVIEAGEPIQFEEAVPSVEGERSYVVVKFLLRDHTGKPYAVCGIATDVSESKRAQQLQAAIARERETVALQRAAELARANDALRGCLDALASVPDLDDFLGQVMAATTRQLGALSSNLRVRNFEQNTMSLEIVFQDGRVMSPAEANYPERWRNAPIDEQGVADFLNPQTVAWHVLDPQWPILESERAYLLGVGVKTVLLVPLSSAGQVNGRLTFRFTEEREFQPEELEIARALAIQASLAIQLTRLARTARQSAVLEERNRLAGEIHDSLAQNFAGISMQLSVAAGAMKRKSGDALSHVERATDLARFGLSEARRSALSLRSDVIEESGLIEALHRLVERSNIPGLLRCSFRSSRVREKSLAPPVQQDLLRIAQEAISNALRHAQPTVISVSLRFDPPNLVLKIRDNGSGIANGRSSGGGFGFANMRARAKNIGAELDIRSTACSGTSVVVRLPIDS
jgi:PAS domain S-box-containing protein